MLTVRPARPGDAEAMAGLLNEIIAIGGTTAHEDPFSGEELAAAYINGPEVICCFVAIDGGELAGFQVLIREAELGSGFGDIATFARVGGTKRGIGSALFAETKAEARRQGLLQINAEIRADNEGGLAYYGRIGFRDHAVKRAVPLNDGRPVDRIVKRLALDG